MAGGAVGVKGHLSQSMDRKETTINPGFVNESVPSVVVNHFLSHHPIHGHGIFSLPTKSS